MNFRSISPRFWLARQLEVAFVGVLLVAGAVAIGRIIQGLASLVPALIALVLVAVLWSVERGRYRSWAYLERADDLIVKRGLLFRRTSVVPYGRMQFIDVTAGPIDRFFGLATVQLHTAAAATDARIPGLLLGDAETLRDRLAVTGEAHATGL